MADLQLESDSDSDSDSDTGGGSGEGVAREKLTAAGRAVVDFVRGGGGFVSSRLRLPSCWPLFARFNLCYLPNIGDNF